MFGRTTKADQDRITLKSQTYTTNIFWMLNNNDSHKLSKGEKSHKILVGLVTFPDPSTNTKELQDRKFRYTIINRFIRRVR